MKNLKTQTMLVLIGLFLHFTASATVRLSGFGNIGVVASNSDTLAYRNDISQTYGKFDGDMDFRTNTKLGLQFEWQNTTHFDAVVQTLIQEEDQDNIEDVLRLAFLRYKPNANYAFRVGRIPLDTFVITEYRDVNYAIPWAKVPNEVYGTIPFYDIDGADVTHTALLEHFNVITKFYTGSSKTQIGYLNSTSDLEMSNITGVSIELQDFDWLISGKFSRGVFKKRLEPTDLIIDGLKSLETIWPDVDDFINGFDLAKASVDYISLGARYDWNNLTLYGELAKINSSAHSVAELKSGYLSLVYRLEQSHFYSIFSYSDGDFYKFDEYEKNDIQVESFPQDMQQKLMQLKAGIEATSNYYASNQQTISVGWRHYLSDSFALTVQLDHSDVEKGGETLWLVKEGVMIPHRQEINTMLINMSFVF